MTESASLSQTSCVEPAYGPEARIPGQPSGFQAIYRAQFSYVWHTLRRLGVRQRDLEDLTHDLFVTVFGRLGSYDPSRPLRPWLFGFAYRLASDYRRLARYRREVVDEGPDAVDGLPLADQRLAEEQQRLCVQEALQTLELDRRAVFVMHDMDDFSMPEIAEALSIPLNTAYSRLRLAREQFTAMVRRLRTKGGAA